MNPNLKYFFQGGVQRGKVGWRGGRGLVQVIFFTKSPNLKKTFFLEGGWEGGGNRLSEYLLLRIKV